MDINLPMPAVSASVSCMDLGHFYNHIKKVEESSAAFFHYDVVDGKFNKCYILGDMLCEYLHNNTKLPVEESETIAPPPTFCILFAAC